MHTRTPYREKFCNLPEINNTTRVIENKIRTENNEIIHVGVFPRRRAALRAARAAGWRGVD